MKMISIIIPIYNERENIPLIYNAVAKEWKKLDNKYGYEIIFVDDGSEDKSIKILKNLASKDKKVRAIIFSKNFGHQQAIEAGLKLSSGDAIIMMDGDLQHPPSLIPQLIQKWEDNFEIVNTKRKKTQNESLFKKITSNIFYSILNKISEVQIENGSADFRLLDKKIVKEFNNLTEKDKFYRGLVNWVGFNATTIEYEAKDRQHGSSSYTFSKMFSLARVGITSFSVTPMKIIIFIGMILFFGGSLLLVIMFYYRYFVDAGMFSGSGILAAFIIANNGILIIMMGINSIYQMSMFKELQNRPNYIIKEEINFYE